LGKRPCKQTHSVATTLALAVVAALVGRLTAGTGARWSRLPKYTEGGPYATVERAAYR
jgi:hypothetical protein